MNITSTYVENGIQVKVLAGCEYKPRPQRSVVEPSGKNYANNAQQTRILNWCNAGSYKNPRRAALAKLSGLPAKRIRNCITTGRCSRLTAGEYKTLAALMPVIEKMEAEQA